MASFETFAVGDPISLVGLLGAPELNGRAGVVISELKEGRYGVKLAKRSTHEPAKALAAKPENLARRAPDAAPSGAAASAKFSADPPLATNLPEDVAAAWVEGEAALASGDAAAAAAAFARAAKMPPLALGPDDDEEEPTPAENSADRARCCANQAAALLADGKFVGAAHAGGQAAAADATWWKGHYFKGEALLALLEGKKASSAMAGRAEQAGNAFKAALAAPSLPADERVRVEARAEQAQGQLMALNPACAQS